MLGSYYNKKLYHTFYDYYRNVLMFSGIKLIKGGKTLSRNYPEDIAYNVSKNREICCT